MAGPTSFAQPWEMAMPAAVVGPPMLALEAMMASSRSNLQSFAPTKQNSMLMTTIMNVTPRLCCDGE